MNRTRVDGTKFEKEIEAGLENLSQPAYYIRLHTPMARLANVSNIADFVVFGRSTVILEAKETKQSSFSLNDFQQKDKIVDFLEFYRHRLTAISPPPHYSLAILVHFIKNQKYVLCFFENSDMPKVIHPTNNEGLLFDTLPEVLTYLVSV